MKFPQIDPTIVELGPLKIRWYGLMYVLGFVASYLLVKIQKKARENNIGGEVLQDLYFYLVVGLVVGARLFYVLFYQWMNLGYYLSHPIEIIAVWHGGMSFHGGLIGCVAAGWIFALRRKISALLLADLITVTAPVGLFLGRVGNFINGELYGRVTDLPWGMVFPGAGPLPRHPSQLYEAMLEGPVLFIMLWLLKDRGWPRGAMIFLFLGLYGSFRFFVEFAREPDSHIGLLFGLLTTGQLLCLAMVAAGLVGGLLLMRRGKLA